MQKKLPLIATAALILVFSGLSQATVLAPGTAGLPDTFGLGTAASPNIVGTEKASTGGNFTTTSAGGATLLNVNWAEYVYADTNNHFCSGCLDFVIWAQNTSASTDSINRITATDFTGFSTDVGSIPPAPLGTSPTGANPSGTIPPSFVDRSLGGDTIGFDFQPISGGIPPVLLPSTFLPGTTSELLVIETDATGYTSGQVNFIDGGTSTVTGFAPVPEPISAGLLLGGLFGAGLLIARKFQVKQN
jgi:hypothetical protein